MIVRSTLPVALLLAVGLVMAAAPRAQAGAFDPADIPGNVNCSESPDSPPGATDSVDAALILQLAAGLVPSLPCEAAGDMNTDGLVDPVDSALILQTEARFIGLVFVGAPLQAGAEPGCYLVEVGEQSWLLAGDVSDFTVGQMVMVWGLVGLNQLSLCAEGDEILVIISIEKP